MAYDMFKAVKDMNVAFGNPEGDPYMLEAEDPTIWASLERQCHNIGGHITHTKNSLAWHIDGEVKELLIALEARNIDKVRDALCDIMVFTLGAFHFAGYDANRDMRSVIDGVLTRFCKDDDELTHTIKKYELRGLQVYADGEFPFKFVKSSIDQVGTDGETYPQGKFLKSVGYKDTVFYQLEESLTARMARERVLKQREDERKHERINAQVKEYRSKLEAEAFGLPAFDPNKNNQEPIAARGV